MTTNTKLAYLAGIIDGEGCFNIYRSGKRPRVDYALRVQIMNTSEALTDWLIANFGGTVIKRPSNFGWKTRYEWFFCKSQIDELIVLTLPYLVIKTKQAQVALAFRKTFLVREHPLSAKTRELRESLYLQMRVLNAKGHIKEPSPLSPAAGLPSRSERV